MQTVSHRKAPTHWRGLDGLRALAVIAVVVYHFSPGTLPGGFLGVDIFFVISGYLITRLITAEFIRRHHVDAPAFYRRRARRLLPALGVVLAAVAASALIWRDQLATVRPGVIFSALFSANWWLAFDHQPYFVATGRPSMLQHLWSLGVEEQFYLFWPLILAAVLATGRRRFQRSDLDPAEAVRRVTARVSAVAITLALLSTGLTWLLADLANVPYGNDGSTLYYGTDTHCMGLLVGAALGAASVGQSVGQPRRRRLVVRTSEVTGWQLDAVGTAALAAVLVLTRTYSGYSHSLYRGGFLLVAALVAIVIGVATGPGSRLGTALEAPLLRWIGVRSYSIYLWHWPVTVVTRPGIDLTMATWIDQLIRIALTVGLAEATYRFVETPTRRLGIGGAARALARYLRRAALPPLTRPAVAVLGVVPVIALGVLVVGPRAPQPAAALSGSGGTHIALETHSTPPPYVGPRQQPHPSPARLPKISGFGDSVLLDAQHTLAQTFGGGSIDAVIGRQPGPILNDVRQAARAHQLNPVVVVQAGNNGLIKPADLENTLQLLSRPGSTVRVVLVVNDHLDPYDHSWQTPNNATIARVVAQFPKALLVNWNKAASQHHDWLYSDDLHLRPRGKAGYAALLATAYRSATS
jgi:peptidoglycan/LPS O-acetylase OafA/YrhL